MPSRRTLALGYAALAATDTVLAGSASPRVRRARLVTKPLLMPTLAAAFLGSPQPEPSRSLLRHGTVAAQALSGVGDTALLSKSDPAFLTGLSAFFGAHVAYTAGFASAGRPLSDTSHLDGVKGAAAAFAGLGPVMSWAAGRKSPQLRRPVLAYAGILCSMFAASTRLDPGLPRQARRTLVTGTALFLASDSILATKRFLLTDPPERLESAVMATYTAGQGLIALGVSQTERAPAR